MALKRRREASFSLMPLITIRDVSIGFRGPLLLDDVSCQIETGERIGLLGRNGAGKTTLMRILRGEVEPDHGEVSLAPATKVALLTQDVPRQLHGSVCEIVSQGVLCPPAGHDGQAAWQSEHQVEQILSRMSLDGEARFEILSSGMKRRVLLARALVSAPELLLLDEPTNHLDIDAIEWLESFLSRWDGTLIFVTHDRMFLRKLATRILEISYGHPARQAGVEVEKTEAAFDERFPQRLRVPDRCPPQGAEDGVGRPVLP